MMTDRAILVVDDAALVRRYYRQLLEPAGYTVDEALNGVEALEKALLRPFALMIVDVNMPKMDGLTFVRTLRRTRDIAATPVLITSSEAQPADRQAALLAGANSYLVKPVAPERLLAQVALMSGGAG
jgi:two-component system chemotaxis response regulator CheY